MAWIISAMYITTAVGAPMAGRLGAELGARRVFLGGLALIATGSIAGAFAPSITWLIVAYVVLGVGISTAPLLVLFLVAGVLAIPNGFIMIGNQSFVNAVTTVDDVGTATGIYRTVAFIGANLAVVVLQVAAGSVINDAGLHRVGWFIAASAGILLVGVALSRHISDAKAKI